MKESGVDTNLRTHEKCEDSVASNKNAGIEPCHPFHGRTWSKNEQESRPPQPAIGRHIGTYALTTGLAPWVKNALDRYQPTVEVLKLVNPFAAEFHDLIEKERRSSTGLHDLDAIELTYQTTLEVGAAIILAADATDDPVTLSIRLHASRAGGDDHFMSWGRLLTGLECDPPIIAIFPFYLLMCQSFTFEPTSHREDYLYSAMTGVDYVSTLLHPSSFIIFLNMFPISRSIDINGDSNISRCAFSAWLPIQPRAFSGGCP